MTILRNLERRLDAEISVQRFADRERDVDSGFENRITNSGLCGDTERISFTIVIFEAIAQTV